MSYDRIGEGLFDLIHVLLVLLGIITAFSVGMAILAVLSLIR